MTGSDDKTRPASRLALFGAFVAVYIIWGSTYMAIRVLVHSVPPFFAAASRNLGAGIILYAFLRARGAARPIARDWRNAGITGFLMLAVGNGGVTWAEQTVPSNLAALIAAMSPSFMAIFDWLRPGGTRPGARTVVGVAIGFVGIVILLSPRGQHENAADAAHLTGNLVAAVGWAAGALHSRYVRRTTGMGMAIAQNMLTGGAILLAGGLVTGEAGRLHLSTITSGAVIALVYLIVFGSLVAFSAYIWLLRVSTPARVSTTAYVNPLVAVVLGYLFLDETLTPPAIAAAALITASVIAMTVPIGRRSGA